LKAPIALDIAYVFMLEVIPKTMQRFKQPPSEDPIF